MDNIDAVINDFEFEICLSVCHAKDLAVWYWTICNLKRFVSAREFIVIVPDSQIKQFTEVTPEFCKVIAESNFTRDFNELLALKVNASKSPNRFGWYLQQFIKLSALNYYKGRGNILIWDSDTLPVRKLKFINSSNGFSYYGGNEHHEPYFHLIKSIGLEKVQKRSFIAQCFPISKTHNLLFFDFLERNQTNWAETLINLIDFDQRSGFSEYETLGTFISEVQNGKIEWQRRIWFRRGWFLFSEKYGITGYARYIPFLDFIACESWQNKSKFRSLVNLSREIMQDSRNWSLRRLKQLIK